MVCPPVCVEFVLLLLLVCFPVLLFPSLLEEGAADPKGKVLLLVGDPKSTGLLEEGDEDEAEGRGPLGRKLGIVCDTQGFCKDNDDCL